MQTQRTASDTYCNLLIAALLLGFIIHLVVLKNRTQPVHASTSPLNIATIGVMRESTAHSESSLAHLSIEITRKIPVDPRALHMLVLNEIGTDKPLWGYVYLSSTNAIPEIQQKYPLVDHKFFSVYEYKWAPPIYDVRKGFWDPVTRLFAPDPPPKFMVAIWLDPEVL